MKSENACDRKSVSVSDRGWRRLKLKSIVSACLLISLLISSLATPVSAVVFEFTGCGVQLKYVVGPDGSEWYREAVGASVYYSPGPGEIKWCTATNPAGYELPQTDDQRDYPIRHYWWAKGYDENPPAFGEYTVTATANDGSTVTFTTWPTDHISDRVPTIIDPTNYGTITTRVPIFRWVPFSDDTTGYRIDVAICKEGWDPIWIWNCELPPDQTEVQYNFDGSAVLPQLLPGYTYRLAVSAHEEVRDGIQWYRDSSRRIIEFTVQEPVVTISTDKYEYHPGDTMTVTLHFENPTDESVDTYFIWLLMLPDHGDFIPYLLISLTLPPYFDQTYNIDMHVGYGGSVGFDAAWYVALLKASVPYVTFSEDFADLRYEPAATQGRNIAERRGAAPGTYSGAVDPEGLAEAILKTIWEVELPGELAQGEPIPEEIANEILEDIAEWQFESTKTDSGEAGAEYLDTAIEHYDWLPAP